MDDDARSHLDAIRDLARRCGRPVQVMEVCGTHTVAIFRAGLRSVLPETVRLVSGPGCPVCVTAQRHIDAAIRLAERAEVIVATYGDMMRVPGQLGSLEQQRARGGDVRVVYSARGALELAVDNPQRMVAFVAVGFETTAPATAAVILEAQQRNVPNFCVLAAHKLVVPAMLALLAGGDVPIDGFLCPGHVSVVIGARAYQPIVDRYRKACVVTGFETPSILLGLQMVLQQIADGAARVDNAYGVAVTDAGNPTALELLARVFVPDDAPWRAMGVIPKSGLALRDEYQPYDALRRLGIELGEDHDPEGCRCGEVIQGKTTPDQCTLFGEPCTPIHPIGPCMVSSEGTCAAWYKYNRPGAQAPAGRATRSVTNAMTEPTPDVQDKRRGA
jgi:hydrogenase expression/formation protein HypD